MTEKNLIQRMLHRARSCLDFDGKMLSVSVESKEIIDIALIKCSELEALLIRYLMKRKTIFLSSITQYYCRIMS